MSSNTTNLKLLKMDPTTDGSSTFNIETMLNENWDKVDVAVSDRETLLKNKTAKTAPADTDSVPVIENAGTVKKTTWAQIKTALKTYFDSLYAGASHKGRHSKGGADALSPADIGALATDGDGKDVKVTFTAAGAKADVMTGDTLAVILGKLKKWYAAFGGAAWLGVGTTANTVAAGDHGHSYGDITDKPSSFAPSAHKTTHGIGGTDAITPEDIGAAPESHTHSYSSITGDIDCGNLDDTSTVAAHNTLYGVHSTMSVDGNTSEASAPDADLAAHSVNPNAHSNIVLDGNQT